MTQAIGRVRRFGQKKHVHVYHFLASKTIDVDLIQARNKMIIKADVTSGQQVAPYPGFEPQGYGLVEPAYGEKGEFRSAVAEYMGDISNDDLCFR
jgi:hypothetical protein